MRKLCFKPRRLWFRVLISCSQFRSCRVPQRLKSLSTAYDCLHSANLRRHPGRNSVGDLLSTCAAQYRCINLIGPRQHLLCASGIERTPSQLQAGILAPAVTTTVTVRASTTHQGNGGNEESYNQRPPPQSTFSQGLRCRHALRKAISPRCGPKLIPVSLLNGSRHKPRLG